MKLNRFMPKPKVDPAEIAGVADGLVEGTRVATRLGWRAVESLMPGDEVLTFDDGFQKLERVERTSLWSGTTRCPEHLRPLRVPADAMGNSNEMLLLAEQIVMIESDVAEEVFGDPFTLVPAAALLGFRGIDRVSPETSCEVVSLCFDEDRVVFANIGALFFCPKVVCGEIRKDIMEIDQEGPYVRLNLVQGETLAAIIESDDAAAKTADSTADELMFAAQ